MPTAHLLNLFKSNAFEHDGAPPSRLVVLPVNADSVSVILPEKAYPSNEHHQDYCL